MSNIFDDMMDWCADSLCHDNPLAEIAERYCAALQELKFFEHIKVNQKTYDALNDQHHAEVIGVGDMKTYDGVPILIDDTLPDNVYKFD